MKRFPAFFRRGFLVLLCGLLLCGLSVPVSAENTSAELRVAFYPLDGFFEYDAAGKETGYGVDLLNKISQYTGISFTYVPAQSWEETKYMLMSGAADVRMPATEPSAPSPHLDYTQHGILDTYLAILTLKSRSDLIYEDYDSLQILRYGVSSNLYQTSSAQDYLAALGITEQQLQFYDGYNACRAALDSGAVDAVISNIMDMTDDMKQLARLEARSNYISMLIGQEALVRLNDALSRIKLEDPAFLPNLYAKWFPERVTTPLSKEELTYLASLDCLTFSFRDGQGYLARRADTGEFVGFYPLVAQRVCDILNVSYRQEPPADRAPEDVVIVPDFYYDYQWADEWDAAITESYFTVSYFQISKKGSPPPVADRKVAAVKEFRITEEFLKNRYSESQMVWCETYADCMEAVYAGKADVTYINNYAAEYYLNLYRYGGLTATLAEFSSRACFAVWGGESALLASALNKTLRTLSSDELSALMVNSTTVKPEQNLLMEWIYGHPIQSILATTVTVSVLVLSGVLLLMMRRAHRRNLQLQEATEAKQEFLSRMSHDMRTPMNAIIGFSGFGMSCEDAAESRAYHEKISQAGQYLLHLVNDSLDLSKLTAGKYELHPEPCLLREFLAAVNNIVQPLAQERGVRYATSCNHEPSTNALLFDKARLEQIFVNLLNNAIKFTPRGGQVSLDIVSSEPAADGSAAVTFYVRDSGMGMSEEFMRAKLFQPFEQENPSASSSGTGLGLSIVHQLVEVMGGTITCESSPGKGTTFRVDLPTRLGIAGPSTRPAGPMKAPALAGSRILLCEDHPLNAEIACRLLQKQGVTVDTVSNGQQGVEQFCHAPAGHYDAILMDIRMPVMDGLTAARTIRGLERGDAKQIPIIAMSANAFPEDVQSSLASGMNAHLAKPIDPQALYDALQQFLA